MEFFKVIAAAVRGLWVRFRAGISRLLSYVDFVLSFLRNPHQLVSAWPTGEIPLGPRVAIFIHFDGRGAVGPHTLHYITALKAAGYDVVLVTNSGKLRPDAMDALRPVCAGVLIRRNIGYDFGAMREGLEELKLPRPNTETVILANDSIYGPLAPLDAMIAQMDFKAADFWGATDSWQQRFHIQSYFIAVNRTVLESKAWKDFWKAVRPVKSKIWVVLRYELGLSQAMVRGGLRLASVWKYHDLVAKVNPAFLMGSRTDVPETIEPMVTMRRIHAHRLRHNFATRTPLNPTSDLWRQLLQSGFPFIKRELLRDNPSHVADIPDWRDEVRKKFGAVPEAIEADLRRVMRNHVP